MGLPTMGTSRAESRSDWSFTALNNTGKLSNVGTILLYHSATNFKVCDVAVLRMTLLWVLWPIYKGLSFTSVKNVLKLEQALMNSTEGSPDQQTLPFSSWQMKT